MKATAAALFFLAHLAAADVEHLPKTDHQGMVTLLADKKCSSLFGPTIDSSTVILKGRECYDATALGAAGFHGFKFGFYDSFEAKPDSGIILPVGIAAYSDASCGKAGGKVLTRGVVSEDKRTTNIIITYIGIPDTGKDNGPNA
ncbi:hypothetical protein K4F52_002367 [Lecanicillium sp. MT-2017a]|nr:hypothetical protein K4F52_002367 [Lecanicillium sp. MT-2017a]